MNAEIKIMRRVDGSSIYNCTCSYRTFEVTLADLEELISFTTNLILNQDDFINYDDSNKFKITVKTSQFDDNDDVIYFVDRTKLYIDNRIDTKKLDFVLNVIFENNGYNMIYEYGDAKESDFMQLLRRRNLRFNKLI